jgi:hypothetical protein
MGRKNRNLKCGGLACGSQAFMATLLFDLSMSALPIILLFFIILSALANPVELLYVKSENY